MTKKLTKKKYGKDQLSEQEQAAICKAYLTGVWDWKAIYLCSHPNSSSNDLSLLKQGSRLKQSAAGQDYVRFLDTVVKDHDQKIKEEAVKEYLYEHPGARQADKNAGVIDYRDRDAFLEDLNSRINCATDEKIKTDLMKLMSDLLRLKESTTGKENEIAKFFMPLSCSECALYKQGAKGLDRIIKAKEKAVSMADSEQSE